MALKKIQIYYWAATIKCLLHGVGTHPPWIFQVDYKPNVVLAVQSQLFCVYLFLDSYPGPTRTQ